jgi:hypothetical protein
MHFTISAQERHHNVRVGKMANTGANPGPKGGLVGAAIPLVLAGMLSAVAVLFLGIVVAFGPEGFGGDGTPTHSERLRSSIGEWSGSSALALALLAVVVASSIKAPVRNRVLMALVACEAAAVLVLIGSTLG